MLEVKDLSFSYGSIRALTNVSIKVEESEIIAIIGSNGAGKTTLMRCIAGQLRRQGGSVTLRETPIPKAAHDVVKMGVAMVPEGRQIFPNLTVEENLEIGGYLCNRGQVHRGKERAFKLFPRLEERRRQLGGLLSGGEQQMLAIARGLMSEPKLLLLDEPSLGLAPMVVRSIFRTLREVNDAGVTILLVEQNAKKALAIANRAYVLETGHIVRTGTGAELLADPTILDAYLGTRNDGGQGPNGRSTSSNGAWGSTRQ